MKFTAFLLGETIKIYSKVNPHFTGDRAINCSQLAKMTNSSSGSVWRQIYKTGEIKSETFLRLVAAMGNMKYDSDKKAIIIKITDSPENDELVKNFCNCHFKEWS